MLLAIDQGTTGTKRAWWPERRYEPGLEAAAAERLVGEWRRAVDRTLTERRTTTRRRRRT